MSGDRRLENAALDLAQRGYHVFPVRPRAKVPLTSNGFKDATGAERTILHWWDRRPDANIGVACGASGIGVLDIDAKHGADPREVIPRLGLEGYPIVWTGEAPPVDKHPDSLEGVRGAQVYFAGDVRTCETTVPGVEFRGAGAYVVAPPSVHPSGVAYEGELPLVSELPPIPEPVMRLLERSDNGSASVVAGDIPVNERNKTLASLAGSMRRRGMGEAEILAALEVTNRTRCASPLPAREVAGIARSIARYDPPYQSAHNYSSSIQNDTTNSRDGRKKFSVRRLRAEDMREPRWAFESYVLAGSINGLVGSGGSGKGTFVAWMVARLTRGELPGIFQGQPANVLVVGDEDSPDEVWAPRIVAAGGNLEHVKTVGYDSGVPLDLVSDIGWLEETVREHGIDFGYFDQLLDHLGGDLNSHVAKDVRQGLGPVRGVARRLGTTFVYTLHPNKLGGARSTRDRMGGSGQFSDLPRSVLALGYHPERDGWRAVARGKGNVGVIPPAFAFTIETGFARNPKTGDVIETGMVGELEQERDLLAEHILPHPPGDRGESKGELAERTVRELGRDGGWRSRAEAMETCARAGVGVATFKDLFAQFWFVERETRGRETWWRLKQD